MKFYDNICCVLQGATQSGKTHFMLRLIQQKQHMFFTPPSKIIVVYHHFQPAYEAMARAANDMTFLPQMPSESEIKALTKGHRHSLLLLDDQLGKLEDSRAVADMFIKNCHHLRISCFVLLQGATLSGRKFGADIINNSHYTILFKSGQLGSVVRSLGIRLNDHARLSKAYNTAISLGNYSYLCVCTHPRAQPIERYSTRVLLDEAPCIILTDSNNTPLV